ncbi:MAG: elongation factor G [Ignavibacteria bacterium]|nr:elongation factor G [Ignavibacteria bacterium]MBI3766070.1 elongation factor G [Ignavibacteriales bacterium]
MKEYSAETIRNIALVGHGGSGKTSFAEASLFTSGVTTRFGKVEEGNTVSDYHPDEVERQISINASVLFCDWKGTKLNIIDTPGYTDFTGEVKSSLRVADTAIVFLKAIEGVEVGTEIVWNYTKELKNAVIVVVNKLNNENADFDKVVKTATERFSHDLIPVQFPVQQGLAFESIVDLLRMKLLTFTRDGKGKYSEGDIPADLKAKAETMREQLIEQIAQTDEKLIDIFFEKGTLTDQEIKQGLKQGIAMRKIFPLLCTAGSHNIGVASLLDFCIDYCPSPTEAPPAIGKMPGSNHADQKEVTVRCDPNGQPTLFVFKTVSEPHVGELSFFRVYSGAVTPGMDLVNESNNKVERLAQLFIMNGKERKEVGKIFAGDIGAVVKLKDTHTNNTLSSKAFPAILPAIPFPQPVISMAIVAKAKGDEDKIATGLHALHEEDPTFVMMVDPELHQTVISGQGELHLGIIIKRLKAKYGVDVEMVEPKIPYRETIRGRVNEVEYKHKKQTGGRGQFGHVWIKIEPLSRGSGFQFENAIVGGVVPGRFVPAVEKGIIEALQTGVIAGYKVVDVKVTLFDGSYHDVDSDEHSFKIAGRMAFKKGFKEAKPILLEPIYEIEVIVPDEYMGDVMGDISSRRGKILGMDSDGSHQIIKALVPLKELFRYSTNLRSMTQGRGIHKQKFDHYEEMPREIADKIVIEHTKQKVEEEV